MRVKELSDILIKIVINISDAVEKGGYLRVYNVNEIIESNGKVLKGWKVQGTNELIDFGLLEYDSSGSPYDYQLLATFALRQCMWRAVHRMGCKESLRKY